MNMKRNIEQDTLALRLAIAAGLNGQARDDAVSTLKQPQIAPLLEETNAPAALARLGGKRLTLSAPQEALVLITQHMPAYQKSVGTWIATKPAQPYAVEHVLAKYNADRDEFSGKATGAALVDQLGTRELQVLKHYSGFEEKLDALYAASSHASGFGKSALDVARQLIGRTLELPTNGLANAIDLNAWQKYREGKSSQYIPIEARIIETEGFETNDEVTKQRYCMLAAPGQVDMMPFRGQTFMNIGTNKANTPSCVMIRAVQIDDEYIEGPGRVSKALHASTLVGKIVGNDILLKGKTCTAGFMPGNGEYSVGKYRLQ